MHQLLRTALVAAFSIAPVACSSAHDGDVPDADLQDPRCPEEPPESYSTAASEGVTCRYEVGCVVDVVSVPWDAPVCADGGCEDFAWEPTEEHTCVPCHTAVEGAPCQNVGETCEQPACYTMYWLCLPDHTWLTVIEGDTTCV